jgi:hypothetical protein
MRKLLVISGKKQHGKDTFAKYIIKNTKNILPTFKYAFADPIKEIAIKMFPQINKKDLWGPSENRENIIKDCINPITNKPLKVRDVLVFIGKYGRQCNENCWVNAAFSNELFNKQKFNLKKMAIVISDGRFLNELEYSKKYGAKIIRIIRPDIKSTSVEESETNLDNVSLDYYDYIVYNNSIEKLKEEAKKVANSYILE